MKTKILFFIFCAFTLFFDKIQAQTPFIDSLRGYQRKYNEYIFNGRNHLDSIPSNAKVIGCYKTLTKKEINFLKKYNHFIQIYGVSEKNLKEISNFQNIISIGVNTHKNINYIRNLKNLKYLGIYSERAKFIPDELFSFVNLESISVALYDKNPNLDNLYKFSLLPNLNSLRLEISYIPKNFNISQLEKLKNIKCLSIGFSSNFVLSNNFHALNNLIFLEIGGDKSSLEKNIEIISKMKNLKYVRLSIEEWDKVGIPNNLYKLGNLKELEICLFSSTYNKLKDNSKEKFKFKTFLYEKQAEIREMFPNTSIGFCFY